MTTDPYGPLPQPEERQPVPPVDDPVLRMLDAYQVWRAYAGRDGPGNDVDDDALADSLVAEAIRLLAPHKAALERVTPTQLDAILQGITRQQEPQPGTFIYAVLHAAGIENRWSDAFEDVLLRCHERYSLFPRLDACW
jgi:hypothetical protein